MDAFPLRWLGKKWITPEEFHKGTFLLIGLGMFLLYIGLGKVFPIDLWHFFFFLKWKKVNFPKKKKIISEFLCEFREIIPFVGLRKWAISEELYKKIFSPYWSKEVFSLHWHREKWLLIRKIWLEKIFSALA